MKTNKKLTKKVKKSFKKKILKKVKKLKIPKQKLLHKCIVTLKQFNLIKRPKVHEYIKNIIYDRQNDKCNLCLGKLGVNRTIDHIVPRSIGGFDNITNYQALCSVCNKWKTYNFDYIIRNYAKNKVYVNINIIKKMQKTEFKKFFDL